MTMEKSKNLVSAGLGIVRRNKRYLIWFYILNLVLAVAGASAFREQLHSIMDHSLYADRVLHGFDLMAFVEAIATRDFGSAAAVTAPSVYTGVLFLLLSVTFMPGVLLGYASDHRISRQEFFRAAAGNVWRFVRLTLLFLVVAAPIAGIIGGVGSAVNKALDKSYAERIPAFTQWGFMLLNLIVLTLIRGWFDLAETDVVLHDQYAVRKSLRRAYRFARTYLGQLLGSYLVITFVGVVVLLGGISLWQMIVPPASVLGAILISQITLFLMLGVRFWQRAAAVSFYDRHMEEPVEEIRPFVAVLAETGQ
jgi:hypothetical protein